MENLAHPAETTPQPAPRLMIPPDEALQLVLDAAKRLPAEQRPMLEVAGLVLDEPVKADRDQPPFDRAMMDGYAVPEGAAGERLPVVAQIAAGQASTVNLTEGQCVEIMTGAPCPVGTLAVVPKEHTQGDESEVLLPKRIEPGQHIAPQGSECRRGEVVLPVGNRIDALAVAALGSFGKVSVRVIRPLRLAIVTTGAELVPPESLPAPSQIRDGNGPMLYTMAQGLGVERPACAHAEDRMASIIENLQRFADSDVLILTGGVSVGRFDLVPDAVKQDGAEVIFHKVRQKPGKPLLFARRGDQLVFGLPGNPLACHLCFHRYVGPAIRKMQGRDPNRAKLRGRLGEPVEPKRGRAHFVLGVVDGAGDLPLIRPLPGKSSADVFRAVGPNCYLEIPPGPEVIPVGEWVGFTWLDGS